MHRKGTTVNTTAKIALAASGGYILGRTKKMKLAAMLALFLAGQKLPKSPLELVQQGAGALSKNEKFAELSQQVTGSLMDAGKVAASRSAERWLAGVSERLRDGIATPDSGADEQGSDEPEDSAADKDQDSEQDSGEDDARLDENQETDAQSDDEDSATDDDSDSESEQSDSSEEPRPASKKSTSTAKKTGSAAKKTASSRSGSGRASGSSSQRSGSAKGA